jgi:hypothetical protein
MPTSLSVFEAVIMGAIPATGEIAYNDFRAIVLSENPHALTVFHQMRRQGKFASEVRPTENGRTLFLSKQGVTNA